MKRFLPAFAILIALSGCKAVVETQVSLKDILESKSKEINGSLYVEVAACNSYEDSRKPSNSVVEAQETIPGIFKDAEYVECFSKNFDSFAHFRIPVALDKEKDGKLASESLINIISDSETVLAVGIPRSLKARIEKAKSDSFGAGSLDLKVNIKIKNDTGKKEAFRVLAAYVDGKPYIDGKFSSKDTFLVTLSDVSVSSALEDGTATVLLR